MKIVGRSRISRYTHHVATDDVGAYPVLRLQQMKADHERRFSHPDRAILSSLTDYTKLEDLTYPTNMRRINRVCRAAVKSRNSKLLMYFNPGRKNVLRNGEDRERLRSC
jgi:hypothetical protein